MAIDGKRREVLVLIEFESRGGSGRLLEVPVVVWMVPVLLEELQKCRMRMNNGAEDITVNRDAGSEKALIIIDDGIVDTTMGSNEVGEMVPMDGIGITGGLICQQWYQVYFGLLQHTGMESRTAGVDAAVWKYF